MITGIFHQGSGLGNQLHRYVATRVRAADLGVGWEMLYNPDGSGKQEGFKGNGIFEVPIPRVATFTDFVNMWHEKKVTDANGVDIRSYDPEFNFVPDGKIIDGEFQDERYWEHREKEIDEWLKVEPLEVPDDTCVIGFRGGEFALYPDLFLTKGYWDEGIKMMLDINPSMRFQVHTDDKPLAQQFFPKFEVVHDIGINWRSMRYAKYAIIANSSFFILPRWLRHHVEGNAKTCAPRMWGRRNIGIWSMAQNYYRCFTHI